MSKRICYYNKNKTKRVAKKWFMIIAAFLVGVIAMSAFSSAFGEKDLNPDNLLKRDNYFPNLLEESEEGLKLSWEDDGSVVLSGKHSDDSIANNALYEVAFVTIQLEAGTYTLDCHNDKADDETFGLWVEEEGTKHYAYAKGVTFEVTESTSAKIGVFVKNNYYMLYQKLYPTLVSGNKSADFFVEETK